MLAASPVGALVAANGQTCTKVGTAAANTIYGTAGIDVICGLGGNDTIYGLGSNDVIDGGTGNDLINGGIGNDKLYGGLGTDTLVGGTGTDALSGGSGSDILRGSSGADTLKGGSDTDTVTYSERNAFQPVTADLDGAADDGIAGENDKIGTDVENLTGGQAGDTLTGNNQANLLDGGPGTDTLNGSEGDDTLFGGLGSDTLNGAAGADALNGSSGNDVLDGGEGNDNLIGDDQLALPGSDTLKGGPGDDTLDGGQADDILEGGEGSDTASYAERGTTVIASLDGLPNDGEVHGWDATWTVELPAEHDLIASDVENLTGSYADDTLTGNEQANILDGGPGADTLIGGPDSDSLTGGPGADTLIGGPDSDSLTGGPGSDTASYADRTGPVVADLDGIADDGEADENDAIGTDIENLTGGQGADTLAGDGNANLLSGGGGNDTLEGLSGDDALFGGTGDDTLIGDSGRDALLGGGGSGDDLSGGAGDDGFSASATSSATPGAGEQVCASNDPIAGQLSCTQGAVVTSVNVSVQRYGTVGSSGTATVTVVAHVLDLGGTGLTKVALAPEATTSPSVMSSPGRDGYRQIIPTLVSGTRYSGTWRAIFSINLSNWSFPKPYKDYGVRLFTSGFKSPAFYAQGSPGSDPNLRFFGVSRPDGIIPVQALTLQCISSFTGTDAQCGNSLINGIATGFPTSVPGVHLDNTTANRLPPVVDSVSFTPTSTPSGDTQVSVMLRAHANAGMKVTGAFFGFRPPVESGRNAPDAVFVPFDPSGYFVAPGQTAAETIDQTWNFTVPFAVAGDWRLIVGLVGKIDSYSGPPWWQIYSTDRLTSEGKVTPTSGLMTVS